MISFIKKYTVVDGLSQGNPNTSHLLETFGVDFETIKRINKKSPRRVWTLIDVGLNYLIAIAGLHHMYRIHYIITEEEWEDKDEEYIYDLEEK